MSDDLDVDDLVGPEVPAHPLWRRILTTWVAPLVGAAVVFQAVGWLRSPSLPVRAPDFELATPTGERVQLSDFRGKTVVLNFWATWCGPCRLEAPSFDAFATANPDIVVLGLAQDPQPALVARSAEKLGIHYPVLLADRQTLSDYAISIYPTTVIVDPQGNVQTAHAGLLLRPQLWFLTLW